MERVAEDALLPGGLTAGYRVRASKRAKRVLLRITPGRGLEVVVPWEFDTRQLPAILERHRQWIVDQLQRQDYLAAPELPEVISLRAESMTVEVAYRAGCGDTLTLVPCGPDRIELTGNVADKTACIRLLQKWLKWRAGHHLGRLLDGVSRETGLKYRSVQVRSQKSRWGSCSRKASISLNCKLMFVEPVLVRYLLIHELCHTVHLDHSERYWSLVERFEPEYRALDAQLRKAMESVPLWAVSS